MAVKGSKWWHRHLDTIAYVMVVVMLFVNGIVLLRPRSGDGASAPDTTTTLTAQDSIVHRPTFDPNTATYRELIEAGLPRKVAVSIIRWREAGKVFRIKEDVALCYSMTDSLYFAIESQIVIGDKYKFHPEEWAQKSDEGDNKADKRSERGKRAEPRIELTALNLDTVGLRYLTLAGFTIREAELVLRYRDIIGGYRCVEEFAECYAVDSVMLERLRPHLVFTPRPEPKKEVEKFPIEINSADSATLCSVRGIGPKSAQAIVEYRILLGGYHSVEQISELSVVTAENFEQILPQIYCDSAEIKKININFAASNELKTHPYITSRMLKLIINTRVSKGGWSTIEEMIEDDILTSEEAMRIAPYLDFGTDSE